jgi:hypothetical protein
MKQGSLDSSASPIVALRLGIVTLRQGISIFDEDGVLRRLKLGFGIPFFAIRVDKGRILPEPRCRRGVGVSDNWPVNDWRWGLPGRWLIGTRIG